MANEIIVAPVTALEQLLDVDRLIDAWVSGRSPKTVEAYLYDLLHFTRWCGASSVGEGLNAFLARSMGKANEAVHRYRGEMLDKGVAPATVNRRLAALRSIAKLGGMFGMVNWTLQIPGVKSMA
jgi:integrase/recombinase XerC